MRISEALDQRWEDVYLDAATACVRGTKSAHGDRTVPLADWLVARLREPCLTCWTALATHG